MLSLFTYI